MRTFWKAFLFMVCAGFGAEVFAGFPTLPQGGVVHWTKTASKNYTSETGMGSSPEETMRPQAEQYRAQCENLYNPEKVCVVQTFQDPPEVRYVEAGVTYYMVRGGARMVAVPVGWCEPPMVLNDQGVCEEPLEEPDPLCYDDVVSGDRICEEIDPNENPTGCVEANGVTMCLDDLDDTPDPNDKCMIVDGKRVCESDTDNKVCGPLNGAFHCVTYEENKGCGYFNGKLVCVDKDNTPIQDDSPDHPKNGGNSDGDETNDATDPRPPEDGGDSDNQPGKPAADFEGVASEKTLRGIKETLDGIAKNGIPGTGGGDGGSGDGGEDGEPDDGVPPPFGGHGEPASWWESNYPDGASGIAGKFSEGVGNGPFMAMLDPLKNLPEGGSAPSWTMNFDFGGMANFGSVTLELPSGVWAFIRFCILFTTVMTVRKLIFGG